MNRVRMMTSAWTMRLAVLALVVVAALVTAGATAGQPQRGVTISVPGIPGPYCMYGIEKRLAEMSEIEQIDLRGDAEEIVITVKPGASVTRQQLEDAIVRAEYPYTYSISTPTRSRCEEARHRGDRDDRGLRADRHGADGRRGLCGRLSGRREELLVPFPPGRGFTEDVLVGAGALRVDAAVMVGANVRVLGVARTLLGVQVSRETPWPAERTPDVVKRFEIRAAVLASSVQTTDGVDLTDR